MFSNMLVTHSPTGVSGSEDKGILHRQTLVLHRMDLPRPKTQGGAQHQGLHGTWKRNRCRSLSYSQQESILVSR